MNVVAEVDKIGYVSELSLDYVDSKREGSKLYVVAEEAGNNRDSKLRLFIIDFSEPESPVLIDNDTLDNTDKTIEWVCGTVQ